MTAPFFRNSLRSLRNSATTSLLLDLGNLTSLARGGAVVDGRAGGVELQPCSSALRSRFSHRIAGPEANPGAQAVLNSMSLLAAARRISRFAYHARRAP